MAHRSRLLLALIVAASLSPVACAGASEDHEDHEDHEGEVEVASSALVASDTVATAVAQSCTTTAVKGLAVQLVAEIQCLRPGTLTRIDNVPGLALGSAVFPYLQTKAAQGLFAAQKARGTTMSINSALRTLPQQFLLYRWYQTGRCGIGLAASPGTSNHEGAIALDINDNAGWRASLTNKGFRWLGASDPVHYDFVGGGTVDLRGLSVRAFQRLWNRNHPNDTLVEDGIYGGGTATRLAQSPVGGFPKGADCIKPDGGAASDAGAGSDAEPDDVPGAAPANVPAVPDATEGDGDGGDTSAPTSSGNGPLTRPAPEATGCAVGAGRTDGGGGAQAALALGLAAVAVKRRRRITPERAPHATRLDRGAKPARTPAG